MLPLLRQCLDSAMSAKAVARSASAGETSALTLGLSRTVDLGLIQAALAELFRSLPGLRLKLRRGTGDQLVELLEIRRDRAGDRRSGWKRLGTARPMADVRGDL